MEHFVVTGATGFVGSNFVSECLRDERVARITALARDGAASARQRVFDALKECGHQASLETDKLEVIKGDLTQPLCGVSPEGVRTAEGAPVFWHLAASLLWMPGKRAFIFQQNVEGTRNALTLAHKLKAKLFVYVSTAYTCGQHEGVISESTHDFKPKFNNAYEESKYTAEKLVESFCEEHGMRFFIMRPSIIVGSSFDHRACGSDSGLYGMLGELRQFRSRLGDSKDVVRYATGRGTMPSFIAVNHVIEDMLAHFFEQKDSPTQNVFHLTADVGPGSPNVGDTMDYMLEKLFLKDRVVVLDGTQLEDPTPLEQFFARRLTFFAGYMTSTKHFARSSKRRRSMTLSSIQKYIDNELLLPKKAESTATQMTSVTKNRFVRMVRSGDSEVPVVSLAAEPSETRELAKALGEVCKNVGFFLVENHGISPTLLKSVEEEMYRFFALPAAEKEAIHISKSAYHRGYFPVSEENALGNPLPDRKEGFDMALELPMDDPFVVAGKRFYGPNAWPAGLPQFKTSMLELFDAWRGLAANISRLFAMSLGLPTEFFVERAVKPLCQMRVVKYPPQGRVPVATGVGCGEHTDYSVVSLIWQIDRPGLQLMNREGRWVNAPRIPGTFVCPLGDTTARYTNDYWPATLHRVINAEEGIRHSAAFFYDLDSDTVIEPLPKFITPERPAQHERTTMGEHVARGFDGTFAYRRKEQNVSQQMLQENA
jgi:isopenicillin N synthase-like dioxygenase/nucleoside-diphosphate-sugar epimerase